VTLAATGVRRRHGPRWPAWAVLPVAALAVVDLASLWLVPLSPFWTWLAIWQVGSGLALAAAGIAGALWRGGRASVLLLVAGTVLLAAPAAAAGGSVWASGVATVLVCALLVPLGLLAIPARTRAVRLLRGLDVLVVLAGGAAVAAQASGSSTVAAVAGTVVGGVLLVAGSLHFELSVGAERRRVLWLVLGVATSVVPTTVFLFAAERFAIGPVVGGVVIALLSMLLPLCIAVAVLDPTMVEVRAVISGTVVSAVMLSLTVAVVALVHTAFRAVTDQVPSLGVQGAVVALLAAGFHPVLVRVRSIVDELLFGGRVDPIGTLMRLGSELSAGSSPQDWLNALRLTLGVPAVEMRVDGAVLARSGPLMPVEVSVTALRVGSQHVGDLVVATPADQLRLPAATQSVLRLVAGPLAQALHATRLADELKASRGRVVAVLEEERRRVRRDLHDGLGPTLTGIAYTADAAANLLPSDSVAVAALLRELRADSAEAIAEIRRIVYGLRPRALDELGLAGAVRLHASRLLSADGRPMSVEVRCPAALPPLLAAVEVAAYRAATEAVTNVARHAGVDRATVELGISEDTLTVTVSDPGSSERPWTPGVGLSAMRERIEQVGGHLAVSGGRDGGLVRAVVPLSVSAAPGSALP